MTLSTISLNPSLEISFPRYYSNISHERQAKLLIEWEISRKLECFDTMTFYHEYEGSKAEIKKERENFIAKCECGWTSDSIGSREEIIVEFEDHVESSPKHKIRGKSGKNFVSVFLGFLFLGYAVSPGIIPYSLVLVGWLDNIFALIFGILFLRKGWNGKSPREALTDIF